MSDHDELIEDLKRRRDEIRVQIHLASKDVQDEWTDIEKKFTEFASRAELDKTGEGLGEAVGKLGEELKLGFQRVRDAMKDA